MNKLILFSMVLILVSSAYATDISTCQNITSPGVYELTANIFNNSDCMIIKTSNVTLDGKGFNLMGNQSTAKLGILNEGYVYNITIKNFGEIGNWSSYLYLINVSDVLIYNNTFKSVNTTIASNKLIEILGSYVTIDSNLINHTAADYAWFYAIHFDGTGDMSNINITRNQMYLHTFGDSVVAINIYGDVNSDMDDLLIKDNNIVIDTHYPFVMQIDCGVDQSCTDWVIDNNTIDLITVQGASYGLYTGNGGTIENYVISNNLFTNYEDVGDSQAIYMAESGAGDWNKLYFVNNTIIWATTLDNMYGFLGESIINSTFENNFINVTTGVTGTASCFEFRAGTPGSGNNNFTNNRCYAQGGTNISYEAVDGINNRLLNFSYNGAVEVITGGEHTRQWYYQAYTRYYGGVDLQAYIEIENGSGDFVGNDTADASGLTKLFIVNDYTNNGTVINAENYTINGTYNNESIIHSLSISGNFLDTFNFSQPDPINLWNITPTINGTYAEGSNTTYNITVTHDEGRDSIATWFVDGIKKLIETVANGARSIFTRTWKYIDEDFGNPHNITVYVNDTTGDVVRFDWTANITNVTPLQAFEQSPDYVSFNSQKIYLYCFVNDSQDIVNMTYRLPGSSEWRNTSNATFNSMIGAWIVNITTEPELDWIGTLDFKCEMTDTDLNLTAYQYDYDSVEVYTTQIAPNTPSQLLPNGGRFNSVIQINCYGTDANGDDLTYDIQANYTNVSDVVTGWEYLSKNDSDGRTEWFILNLPVQNETKIRCRSHDGLNYSQWYQPNQVISISHGYALQMFSLYTGTNLVNTNLIYNVYCSTQDLNNSDIFQTWADCNNDGQWDYVFNHFNKTNMTGRVATTADYFTCKYLTDGNKGINIGCVTKRYNTSVVWDKEICSSMKESDTYCNYRKRYGVVVDEKP